MKRLLLVAACLVATVGALAQGQINFQNRVGAAPNFVVNAPIFDADKTTALAGTGFNAQLYVGADEASLAAVGTPAVFRTGAGAGYFIGGVVTTAFPFNATVKAQVRAWENKGGAGSYEAALSSGNKYGKSNTLDVKLPADAVSFPSDLVGLQSFSLIPEPSTIALGVLGAAALLLRRRK